ncbi:AMP-binding protein [Shinella sp. BYT-45]|uniref:AMP-binding protein n=1 Tax=Shinella sp. BYT-45 TaxID=3377377 RepID=UPI003981012A
MDHHTVSGLRPERRGLSPLNSAYTLRELDYFLGDANPPRRNGHRSAGGADRCCDPSQSAGSHTGCGWHRLPAGAGRRAIRRLRECGPGTLAAILYTSGTTGRSKGAILAHEDLLSNAMVLKDHWRFGPDDRLINALPIFHTMGFRGDQRCPYFRCLDVFPYEIRCRPGHCGPSPKHRADGRADVLCPAAPTRTSRPFADRQHTALYSVRLRCLRNAPGLRGENRACDRGAIRAVPKGQWEASTALNTPNR